MKISTSRSSVGMAALVALLFFAPLASHADTYQIYSLNSDNRQFLGLNASGSVFLSYAGGGPTVFETYTNGVLAASGSTLPTFIPDYAAVNCPLVCSVSYNGRTASFVLGPNSIIQQLFVLSGSGPAQLITQFNGVAGVLAINGTGDIVFDNGFLDEWYEAIDLTTSPVPEPNSLLLFATGALFLGGFVTFRRNAHA